MDAGKNLQNMFWHFNQIMGLFIGQPKEFFEMMRDLAMEADAATRECD